MKQVHSNIDESNKNSINKLPKINEGNDLFKYPDYLTKARA